MTLDNDDDAKTSEIETSGTETKKPEKINWAFICIIICVFLVVFVFGAD